MKSGFFLASLLVAALCLLSKDASAAASVRKVDYSEAPEMRDLAQKARQIGNETYPKIVLLLGDKSPRAPRQFDIDFKKHLEHSGMGSIASAAAGATISLNAAWLVNNPTNGESYRKNATNLTLFLVHEMGHLAAQFRPGVPSYWEEGIADYVRYRLGYTNGWSCPQCSVSYPHYTCGYWCAGAFLSYVDALYGSNVIHGFSAALRRGSSPEEFFLSATGRSVEDLWAGFQQTPAYTPIAAQLNKWQAELGFLNGKPPNDYDTRLAAYMKQHPAAAQTQEAGKLIVDLIKTSGLPPAGEHGTMSFGMPDETESDIYPLLRTFHAQKNGDPSLYHYTVVRESKDAAWKPQRAWQTSADGRMLAEYPIQP